MTFRALASDLGVTPRSIAYHVGTREELFGSLVEQVFAGVASALEEETDDPVMGLLMRYCERVIAHPKLTAYVLADLSLMSDELSSLTR